MKMTILLVSLFVVVAMAEKVIVQVPHVNFGFSNPNSQTYHDYNCVLQNVSNLQANQVATWNQASGVFGMHPLESAGYSQVDFQSMSFFAGEAIDAEAGVSIVTVPDVNLSGGDIANFPCQNLQEAKQLARKYVRTPDEFGQFHPDWRIFWWKTWAHPTQRAGTVQWPGATTFFFGTNVNKEMLAPQATILIPGVDLRSDSHPVPTLPASYAFDSTMHTMLQALKFASSEQSFLQWYKDSNSFTVTPWTSAQLVQLRRDAVILLYSKLIASSNMPGNGIVAVEGVGLKISHVVSVVECLSLRRANQLAKKLLQKHGMFGEYDEHRSRFVVSEWKWAKGNLLNFSFDHF